MIQKHTHTSKYTQAVNIAKDTSTLGHKGVDRAGSHIQTTGVGAVKPACPIWIILEMCLRTHIHTHRPTALTQMRGLVFWATTLLDQGQLRAA